MHYANNRGLVDRIFTAKPSGKLFVNRFCSACARVTKWKHNRCDDCEQATATGSSEKALQTSPLNVGRSARLTRQ